MAHLESCRIEAVSLIDKKIDGGLTVREALKAVSEESDIPTSTLNRWKYPLNGSVLKNEHKQKTTVQHWKAALKRLRGLDEYMRENCILDDPLPPELVAEFDSLVTTLGCYQEVLNEEK